MVLNWVPLESEGLILDLCRLTDKVRTKGYSRLKTCHQTFNWEKIAEAKLTQPRNVDLLLESIKMVRYKLLQMSKLETGTLTRSLERLLADNIVVSRLPTKKGITSSVLDTNLPNTNRVNRYLKHQEKRLNKYT